MFKGNSHKGMTRHGKCGYSTQSPKFRFLTKLEAERNEIKDRSKILDPKQSVYDLFHKKE